MAMDFGARELTEEEKQSLIYTSKMTALGEMAGSIAHEINNPLSIIYGRARQMKDQVQADLMDKDSIVKCAEKIALTALRISRIIKSLRTFARNGEGDPFEPISIRSVIDDTLEMCHQRFNLHEIEIRVSEVPEALKIDCRATQIAQVLLNLLNNAHDAVEKLESRWVQIDVLDRSESVEVAVTDSGSGVPPEILEKVFHPLFTTKEPGKGTGMGLSISRNIIERHGGSLRIDAESSNTRFLVTIPKRHVRPDQMVA